MESESSGSHVEDGVSAGLSAPSDQPEGTERMHSTQVSENTTDPEVEGDGLVEEANSKAEDEKEGGEEDGMEGEELSSTSSATNTVMTTDQVNGDESGSSKKPTKTAPKSPSVCRTGRRNQETKDDRSSFICPLCDKNCLTQHQLTMHIRQHNTDSGGTDHSCSICGKALSSASSLDRHMLVHSGERPYKCSVCGQTFTTNGNMHRHMKIHDKDQISAASAGPPSPNKRRRPSAKKRFSLEDEGENADPLAAKKVMTEGQTREPGPTMREEELLHCPICFKTFICKYGLESHMETHPDTALRCSLCCITFRTHRGLLRHNSVVHKQLPTDPTGRPFIQSNPSVPIGFSDLAFVDFSCHKFPQIAQVWCETNLRRCSSKFHRFVCEVCNKAFPMQGSLSLHTATHKASADTAIELQKQTENHLAGAPTVSTGSKEGVNELPQEDASLTREKMGFMECLGLQHSSQIKPVQSDEDVIQTILDSISVIRVEPCVTNLPQEANGNLGLPFLETIPQGKSGAISLLSLKPFQSGYLNSGLVVQRISGQAGVELADIQQILKLAASVPSQMTLPLLHKAPGNPSQPDVQQISPVKPKLLVTPRSSMGTSTPPPTLMSAQQASSGNISPNLPPPTGQLLGTPRQSSASSSSSSPTSQGCNWESTLLGPDGSVTSITAYEVSTGKIKEEEVEGKEKQARTGENKKTPVKTEYPCRFCSEVFSFPSGLQAHMRLHMGASPYQCSICSYAAPDKATLIRHLRTHSGERPYVCRLCHYPFTVKANCERHLRKKHMKNSRKEIEKNIEYVTTTTNSSGVVGATTLDLAPAGTANTVCRYCGEDLTSYRALQIHLRTHNGCQRKPFECRQCGAAFLAKRNCIHHLLKQHPDVPEREIEEHINTFVPVTAAHSNAQSNGVVGGSHPQSVKQDLSTPAGDIDQDQPLDFSSKAQSIVGVGIKVEDTSSPKSLPNDCSVEPIDLSIPKVPERKRMKKEDVDPMSLPLEVKRGLPILSTDMSAEMATSLQTSIQLSLSNLTTALNSDLAKPPNRLKPLLPKPAVVSKLSELPPLASIAQIISSVSAAPVLLKTGINAGAACGLEKKEGSTEDEILTDKTLPMNKGCPKSSADAKNATWRGRKRPAHEGTCDPKAATGSAIDLESSGEFPSVEKMLATTDANKFSPYLRSNQEEPVKDDRERERQSTSEEEKDGKEDKPKIRPQSKGKKNAYSNSLQKMTCPYCPRVFPWASSLQRHMLTHTGQKPYPCPKCDAFFSTKSNCERHLLRKHGVAGRSLQHNGSRAKPKSDEGSQGSAESVSDAEQAMAGDALDLSSASPNKEGHFKEQEQGLKKQPGSAETEHSESNQGQESTQPSSHEDNENNDDDDSQSNNSLDLNLARKLIDFKLLPNNEQTHSQVDTESLPLNEFPHTCATCKKSFRHAAILNRHQKGHMHETLAEDGDKKGRQQSVESSQTLNSPPKADSEKKEKTDSENEGGSRRVESGTEEEEKERDERSDEEEEEEECSSSELRGMEDDSGSTDSKSDKRKKICNVCSKRFWSLQDLTRHMRSHTGERPYKCQTCERTFTLKHSLVRHQRIHQKLPDGKGAESVEDIEESDGARDDTGAEGGEGARSHSGSESELLSPGSVSLPNEKTENEIESDDGQVTDESAVQMEIPNEEKMTDDTEVIEKMESPAEPLKEPPTDNGPSDICSGDPELNGPHSSDTCVSEAQEDQLSTLEPSQ